MKKVAVLIPTYNRTHALAVTLTSLCFQDYLNFEISIADQNTDPPAQDDPIVQTVTRMLNRKGVTLSIKRNLPRRGMAQQRQFLLQQSQAPLSLFLDDDVILEPWAIRVMAQVLDEAQCGLTGMAVIGLSFQNDVRPEQQQIEFWEGPVEPETVTPESPAWQRHKLHNAANLLHVQDRLGVTPESFRTYKIAWIGGCVMYDTDKLREVGGFEFYRDVPTVHAGEDVVAQQRVMAQFGACGIIPSGAYHLELPTTIPDRDVDLPKYLDNSNIED